MLMDVCRFALSVPPPGVTRAVGVKLLRAQKRAISPTVQPPNAWRYRRFQHEEGKTIWKPKASPFGETSDPRPLDDLLPCIIRKPMAPLSAVGIGQQPL